MLCTTYICLEVHFVSMSCAFYDQGIPLILKLNFTSTVRSVGMIGLEPESSSTIFGCATSKPNQWVHIIGNFIYIFKKFPSDINLTYFTIVYMYIKSVCFTFSIYLNNINYFHIIRS